MIQTQAIYDTTELIIRLTGMSNSEHVPPSFTGIMFAKVLYSINQIIGHNGAGSAQEENGVISPHAGAKSEDGNGMEIAAYSKGRVLLCPDKWWRPLCF